MNVFPPEPWDYGLFSHGSADEPVEAACVFRKDDPDDVLLWANIDLEAPTQDAVVRRTAACVNLCQGIPTEAVEAMRPGWWQRNAELRMQNAELLAAAVEVATWLEQRTEHYQGLGSGSVAAQLHAHANILRTAILRARAGEQP